MAGPGSSGASKSATKPIGPDKDASGDIYLDVGYASQIKAKDPTGCWYVSATMVGWYFEQGPRLGVPSLWGRDLGTTADGKKQEGHFPIPTTKWNELLANEHMEAIPEPAGKAWTAEALSSYLRIYGPLIFWWTKTNGGQTYGHISVLIGASKSKQEILIHDPEDRPKHRMSIATFNGVFAWGVAGGQGLVRKIDGAYRMKNGLTTRK